MILVLVLSGLALLAQAPPLPCNRLVKVIATGSIAERGAMAASVTAPAGDVVKACPELLRRGFGDPLRMQLPKPSIGTWRVENQWLAAYLLKTPPRDAAFWISRLDVHAVPPETLAGVIDHWGNDSTVAAGAIFDVLRRVPAPAFRNEALHRLEAMLITLEATDVTTATHLRQDLDSLGFGYLIGDPFRSGIWSLRLEAAPVEVTAAETHLAQENLVKAFHSYAAASKLDGRYLVHAALMAEELMGAELLRPTELIPLGIVYQKCGDIYIVNWKFGALYQVGRKLKEAELRAVVNERASAKCADDFMEKIESSREALEKFAQSETARRFRLRTLAIDADKADVLSNQGRLTQGNVMRENIWREVYRPESYRFLGGPTRARLLKDRVGQFLAFPPEPEVHVNEDDHLKRNERGEIVRDDEGRPPEDEDVPYDYNAD